MSEPSGRELERVLLRRQEVLNALVRESRTKPELVAQLDIPRSTLDDIVRDLSDAGLVAYVDGRWQSTPVGSCARGIYQSYAERMQGLAEAVTVLEGSDVTEIDCAMLDGCTVFENDGVLPDKVVIEFLDRLRSADTLHGLVPRALAGHVPTTHEAMLDGTLTTTEMVFEPTVYEKVVEMYPDQMRDELERDHVDHYLAEIPVSFGLWIADDENAGAMIYSDEGVRGIIVNDSDAAVEWARDTYEQARDGAGQVTELPT